MANFTRMGIPELYIGASGDSKLTGVPIGSRSYEHDTGKEFITYDGTNWVEYTSIDYLNNLYPIADDTYDIGENSTPLEWKDLYIDGVAYIDTLQVEVAGEVLDNIKLGLGTGSPYWAIYNSGGSQFELWGTDVDGAGADGLIMSVDDGDDVVDFTDGATFGGKVTLGANEIEGSNFDIDGGDLSAITVSGGLTWNASQNFGAYAHYIL